MARSGITLPFFFNKENQYACKKCALQIQGNIFLRNIFEFDLWRMCCFSAVSVRSCSQGYEEAGYVQANVGESCFDRPNVLQKQNIKVNCVYSVQ
jgi:hypothetical protein